MNQPILPTRFQVAVLRAPINEPVRTAFGVMRDRPLVLIGISDADGRTGWGEVWCNFPACGAEHRARLFQTELVPLLTGQSFHHPADCYQLLSHALRLLVNQSGEAGPVAQVIAGIDIALWDLYAQRSKQPLYQALAADFNSSVNLDQAAPRIPVYASGLNPTNPEEKVREKQSAGYTAFKLKVGFDDALDVRNATAIRNIIGSEGRLMLDANQGWDLPRATRMASQLSDCEPMWLEEPLPVDSSLGDWRTLAENSAIALAGGENLRGLSAFEQTIDSGLIRFVQPDIAKWGGLTGALAVAKKVRNAGLTYCPHWLGGGVGLMASAHLLAAVGGDGLLEVDANPNPLRDKLLINHNGDSMIDIDDQTERWQPRYCAGIGVHPNPDTIEQFGVLTWQST